MKRVAFLFLVSLLLSMSSLAGSDAASDPKSIRLMISEVQPGSMSADQYCTLVFGDRRFHSEKASRHHGQDVERKVFEGELSPEQWTSLIGILDAKDLKDLKVPPTVPPLVMQDTHPYAISIARDGIYQNFEFIDSKSLKPYQGQIKPLLQWWKSLRAQRTPPSSAPASERCSLDNSHAVFSQ
jgi:hypothetical protein